MWPGAIKTEEFFDNIDKSPLKPIFLDTAASTEYVEKVVVLLCKESNKQIMQRSGKTIFSDDIAGQSGIKDLDRSWIPNSHSLSLILSYAGYKRLVW